MIYFYINPVIKYSCLKFINYISRQYGLEFADYIPDRRVRIPNTKRGLLDMTFNYRVTPPKKKQNP